MKPKPNSLFHFTNGSEALKSILKIGFWPHYCLEDVRWLEAEEHEYIGYPMACFCDIPLARIHDHVGFYGSFGLGLSKQWAEANGLNPVLYLPSENSLTKAFRDLNAHANKLEGKDRAGAKVTMRYMLAHTKPYRGYMVVDGEPVEKDFYLESEWRYVPKHEKIVEYLPRGHFDNSEHLLDLNAKSKNHGMLLFSPNDVRYIFVKTDSEIPDMIDFIQTQMDSHVASELKVLMSRVISLESLAADV